VLVIEDHRDVADSLELFLDFLGHDVAVAYTGTEGVTVAFAWRPDVVLSDIGLPGLDGWGVARELRRDPRTSGARLIAITGYGSQRDHERSREAGFDFHLVKPCDPGLIKELLTRP
jgi:two-component system, sensor histidine kinase